MPVYLLDMLDLPQEIESAFIEGLFIVCQTTGQFKQVWSDMGTEKKASLGMLKEKVASLD